MKRLHWVLLMAILVLAFVLSACNGDSAGDSETTAAGGTAETTGSLETPTHTHEWGEWQVSKDATCTEEGEEKRTCSCGEAETRSLDAKGHLFGEWQVSKEATCTEEGELSRSCSCGKKEKEGIPKKAHVYDVQNVLSKYICADATCTEPAEYYYSCKCGAEGEETFTAGHPAYHQTVNGICRRCGDTYFTPYEIAVQKENERYEKEEERLALSEASIDASYDLLQTRMQNLGVSSLSSSSYYSSQKSSLINQIAKKQAQKSSYQINGDYYNANRIQSEIDALQDDYVYYSNCYSLATEAERIRGRYSDLEESKMQNASQHAQKLKQLSSDYEQLNTMYAQGHMNFKNEWTAGEAPTCTENGTELFKCDFCDFSLSRKVNSLGHDLTVATCTEPSKCTRCSYCGSGSLGHYWLNATCTLDQRCSRCGTLGETKALGHNLVHYKKKDVTCTEPGWEAYDTCSRCSYTTQNIIEAKGHDLVAGWTVVKEPTPYEKGLRTTRCSSCGDVSEEIDMLPCSEGLEFQVLTNSSGEKYAELKKIGSCKDTKVVIPKTYNGVLVTSIGDYAFDGCTGLTSITIGKGVTSIGRGAFSDCTGLESITIPDSVTSIADWAFSNCTSLTSITIGKGVTSIGDYAFDGCEGLTAVYISDIAAWCKIIFGGTDSFPNHYGELHILDEKGNEVTEITIPNGITCIGWRAFRNCTGLTSITIPDSVTSIGDYAFDGCTGLTSITIGKGVTSIGRGAFSDCTGLESITLPFVGASRDATSYSSHFGYIFDFSISFSPSSSSISYSSRFYTYHVPSSLRQVVITDATHIADWAFSKCTGLTSITIPDSVTSIGYAAFRNCTGLTSITIGKGVSSIGDYAFYGCTGLTDVYYTKDRVEWRRIDISNDGNESLTKATIHYNNNYEPD